MNETLQVIVSNPITIWDGILNGMFVLMFSLIIFCCIWVAKYDIIMRINELEAKLTKSKKQTKSERGK